MVALLLRLPPVEPSDRTKERGPLAVLANLKHRNGESIGVRTATPQLCHRATISWARGWGGVWVVDGSQGPT